MIMQRVWLFMVMTNSLLYGQAQGLRRALSADSLLRLSAIGIMIDFWTYEQFGLAVRGRRRGRPSSFHQAGKLIEACFGGYAISVSVAFSIAVGHVSRRRPRRGNHQNPPPKQLTIKPARLASAWSASRQSRHRQNL
jgi:hypothetical protein